MSQAFAKEGDADDDFPERPIGDRPNYVTPAGLAELKKRREDLARRRETLAPEDRKLVERDLRYYDARIAGAVLVPKPAAGTAEARFGSVVEVQDGRKNRRFEIVGEDEADPARGKVAWSSPIASALIGAKAGDEVCWEAEDGRRKLKVLRLF